MLAPPLERGLGSLRNVIEFLFVIHIPDVLKYIGARAPPPESSSDLELAVEIGLVNS